MALAHKVMQVHTPNMLGPQDGQPCGRLSGLVSACRYVSVCVCVSMCNGVGLDGPLRLTRIHVVGLSVELFAPRSE